MKIEGTIAFLSCMCPYQQSVFYPIENRYNFNDNGIDKPKLVGTNEADSIYGKTALARLSAIAYMQVKCGKA